MRADVRKLKPRSGHAAALLSSRTADHRRDEQCRSSGGLSGRAEHDADGTRRHGHRESCGAASSRATDEASRIVVFCGPGNNGGDGFVAARHLKSEGYHVSVGLLGTRDALKGDAAWAARGWDGEVLPFDRVPLEEAHLAIAAIFGAGLARDIEGAAKTAILRLNEWARRTRKPVVAVDIPSGVDGSTGRVRGVAVEATQTVTFLPA